MMRFRECAGLIVVTFLGCAQPAPPPIDPEFQDQPAVTGANAGGGISQTCVVSNVLVDIEQERISADRIARYESLNAAEMLRRAFFNELTSNDCLDKTSEYRLEVLVTRFRVRKTVAASLVTLMSGEDYISVSTSLIREETTVSQLVSNASTYTGGQAFPTIEGRLIYLANAVAADIVSKLKR